MEAIKEKFLAVLDRILCSPPTSDQRFMVGLVALIAALLGFLHICEKIDYHRMGFFAGLFHVTAAGAAIIAVSAIAELIAPRQVEAMGEVAFLLTVTVCTSLTISVPFLVYESQGRYWATAIAWFLSIAIFIGTVYVMDLAYRYAQSSHKQWLERSAHPAGRP